jgi:hypothetical protein
MSWWWKPTNARDSDKPSATANASPPVVAADGPTPQRDAAIPSLADSPKRILTREEQAEQEWNNLLKELQAETNRRQPAEAHSRQHKQALPVESASSAVEISPDSLYPTEMSCRSSFDYAMFCQSFGGQFVNVYRYGSFRSCSNHWDDFWLCMRTRQWKPEDRQKAIQEHYRKKAVKWKTGPSSEDIWEVRTEPVMDPISGNLAEAEAEMAELAKNTPAA